MKRFTTDRDAKEQVIIPALGDSVDEHDIDAIFSEAFAHRVDIEDGNEVLTTAGFEQVVDETEFWQIVERHTLPADKIEAAAPTAAPPNPIAYIKEYPPEDDGGIALFRDQDYKVVATREEGSPDEQVTSTVTHHGSEIFDFTRAELLSELAFVGGYELVEDFPRGTATRHADDVILPVRLMLADTSPHGVARLKMRAAEIDPEFDATRDDPTAYSIAQAVTVLLQRGPGELFEEWLQGWAAASTWEALGKIPSWES